MESSPAVTSLSERVVMWFMPRHTRKLDAEVLRRKSEGEDRDENGKKINVNRGTVVRDLIDERWPDGTAGT